MTGRATPEWIGKTPDMKVPGRVRVRIFARENGICHISGRRIRAGELWDLDHKIALCNGGEHREANLFPALRDKHRVKTAEDVAEKARVAKRAKSHLGIKKPSTFACSKASPWKRRFDGTVVSRATGEPRT